MSDSIFTVKEVWSMRPASSHRMCRTPTFWERLRFGLTAEWRMIWQDRDGPKVVEVEWEHIPTRELRRFHRGRTQFSRWRRVS